MRRIASVCFSVLMLLEPMGSAAQERVGNERFLPRLSGPVELDGHSDEPAWAAVEPFALTRYEPFEADLTERTEIRVAYDDDYLYAAGRFYDSEPDGVRTNSLYRDRYSGDDTFGLVLDTFNDNENALWFYTSPAGVRFDVAVANDAEFNGAEPTNESWNTHWDVATVRTEEGWFAEMRIPYSSLGFQSRDNRVAMGLIAYRYIARKNERHIYPAIPPNWGMGFAKPSVAQDVVLEDVTAQKPLYVTPYTLAGFSQETELGEAGTAYQHHHAYPRDLGLDLKYNLTNNLTLDATVNTDFAQVEADDQQVNLTRFSLFFPEKRQFFQERAGLFDFTLGGSDRLFHSRRIGLNDGEAIPILGGARLVGRVGAWDVGLLDMQTGRSSELPSENFGVVRLRRQVFNPFSYAGAMLTSRLGTDGNYNIAYGLDGSVRLAESQYATLKWAQTFDDSEAFGMLDAGLFFAQLENRTRQGLGYNLRVTRSGAAYKPELGFVGRSNFTGFNGWGRYGVFPGEASRYNWRTVGGGYGLFLRNGDGSAETAWVSAWFFGTHRAGGSINPWVNVQYEDLRAPLAFPEDTEVPTGRYTFYTGNLGYEMAEGRLLRANLSMEGGTFYDGWQLITSLEPVWNVSRFVELSSEYELNRIRFPDRGQGFDAHILRLRTQVALNTKVSANAFVQYNSAADLVAANLRFRYNFREGNDLWIVYNQGLNADRYRERPILPPTDSRTFMLKYTYTFRM